MELDFRIERNKIYNMPSETGMYRMHLQGIKANLVVTSPPYNVDLGNNKKNKRGYDKYNDALPLDVYLDNMKRTFSFAYQVLEDDGRVAINVGSPKNGEIPIDYHYTNFMTQIGFHFFTHIIWDKSQVGNRTAWGSWMSPSRPSFPTPFEHILIFYKNSSKLTHKGETDLTRDEFIDWSLALWKFQPENKQKEIGHPAMFPEELPKRLIKMLSYKGDLVLDPFNGAGTTTKVAKNLGRDFIGFDISEDYCKIAERRLEDEN